MFIVKVVKPARQILKALEDYDEIETNEESTSLYEYEQVEVYPEADGGLILSEWTTEDDGRCLTVRGTVEANDSLYITDSEGNTVFTRKGSRKVYEK